MKRLDLIIDALESSRPNMAYKHEWKKREDALAAAKELRNMKPSAWKKTIDGSEITRSQMVANELGFTTALYALDEEQE